MAQIIDFTPPDRDVRTELCLKLERAPREHVEALLDLYAVVQLLHEKGILELAKGFLGSGEKVLKIWTETLEADEVVRFFRNLTVMVKVLGAIEPDSLQKIVDALGHNLERAKTHKPPGTFKLLRGLLNPETRRMVAPFVKTTRQAGRKLRFAPTEKQKPPRQRTTRHSA